MSLPTPPATSHHRDKEIRLPGSRVAWAQQNQYFVLSYTPAPSLSLPLRPYVDQPTKSILKKRDYPCLLPLEENLREITPEPEDPLADLTYLSRPVEQVISSDATLRDLIEAYSVLHARLRAAVASSTDADASWPLFQPLRKHTDLFTQAVCRDLGRALVAPKFELLPEDGVPLDCEKEDEEDEACTLLPSPKQTPKKKKQGMSASQIKFARDLCTTTHAVLRLLSAIFMLQPLHQLFDDAQLCDMLSHVLAIPMADEIPTPNARKTCALSIWLLQVQRLPETVLLPARDRIAFALRRGMEGELGKEGKKGSACDGLKAIYDLSLHQPATFIPAFTELLPSILANLLAPTLSLRAQACHALGGFVLGCVTLPPGYLHARISNTVSTFLTTSTSSSRSPSKRAVEPAIIRALRTTLNTFDPQHVAQGPVWALSVLASLIVLLGPLVCTDARLNRIVTAQLTLAMRNKKSSVRALASLLWRCIAWAYLRPPLGLDPEGGDGQEDSAREQDIQVARENSWKLIRSVVDMGTGVSTVAALLGDDLDDEDRLRKALQVVKVMINKGGQTTLDAIDIANTLVNYEHNGKSWSMNKLLPYSLFSSNPGLLTADYKTLSTAVKPIFDECPQLTDIRPLTRDQLARDWVFNELVEIWTATLGCLTAADDHILPSETLSTWNGLMKSNVAALLDADDHDGVTDFASKSACILTEILRDLQLELPSLTARPTSSKTGSRSGTSKPTPMRCNSTLKLGAVRELWACMRTVFPSNLLHAGGAKLLECLVEDEPDLVWDSDTPEAAREEWVKLCAETLALCDIEQLEKFWVKRSRSYATMPYEPGVRGLVWGCFVETWTADPEASWEGATVLLGVPFDHRNAWELSNDEFGAWDGFLKHAMNKANDNGTDAITVLDHVASRIARTPCPAFASATRVADLLLSHCEMEDMRELPGKVFEFVNDTLLSTYPPAPRNVKPSIWLITSLTHAVGTCPIDMRLNLLEATQDGIVAWLSDEYLVFTRDEYALDVLPLYQTVLLGIQELPCTLGILEVLSPFLQSVFVGRDDKPRVARDAFTDFWTTISGDVEEPAGGWPEDLRICLALAQESLSEVDSEPSSDLEELEDVIVCAPPTDDGPEDLSLTPASSPRFGSVCSAQTLQASEDESVSSPFIGRLGPASFVDPLTSLAENVSPLATPKVTEPSTPVTGSRSSRLPTPSRPHKPMSTPESFQSLLLKTPAGTLPVYPTTPTTPRSPSRVRSSLSPGKGRASGDKENVSPLPAVERLYLYSTPSKSKPLSVLGKRQMIDELPDESITKKGRSSFIRSSIEFPSASDNDLEEEMAVEAVLSSPARKVPVQPVAQNEISPTTTHSRKRKRQRIVMDAVLVPSLAVIQRRQRTMQRRASTECVSAATGSADLRRSASMSKLHDLSNDETAPLRRKRMKLGVDMSPSASLTALEEAVIAGSDDSIMLAGSASKHESEGSDDDPYLGQVSPRHLASPAPRRHVNYDYDSSSDDAPSSSPSRDLVARRQQRFGLVAQRMFR